MVMSTLATRENITIKSQNRVAMVQTSKEITRWHYGCNFRLVLVLLKNLSFLSRVRLGCHSKQCLLAASNCKLTFYKTRQLPTGLPKVSGLDWVSGLFFWKEMRFILSIKIPVVTPPTTSNWVCYINGRPRDCDFNHTRLRSRTWNSETLPIQCLFSKLRQSYTPFWQEDIRVIVAQFPELKLSRAPWGSGVQILSVFPVSYL